MAITHSFVATGAETPGAEAAGKVVTSKWNADHVIASGTITLAMMADVATGRFFGRTTAGTGVPEALTAAQATALLDAFVGDSGAGGTKGLVPAPAAGDAAANKFLKANGTWAAAGGGSVAVGDITGLGTGVATALAVNVGSAGAFVTFDGAGGTPSSLTLTNATGLPAAGVVGTAAVLTSNTFTNTQTVNPAANTSALIISGGSITGSGTTVPGITVAGTLNTSGVVVGAVLYGNITATAIGAGTTLIDVGVGGGSYASRFKVDTAGLMTITPAGGAAAAALTTVGVIDAWSFKGGALRSTSTDLYLGVSNGNTISLTATAWNWADGQNQVLGTTTGTKIGTGTTQKLAFWNATPVVQQVLATGGGATVDNVITFLQTIGLCKQS